MLRLLLILCLPGGAHAESVVAARTIRAQTIVAPDDVTVSAAELPGAISRPEEAFGLETRVTIYAGRPVRASDLGPPAIIERNQVVAIRFHSGALAIEAEGRALARGGVGDAIRVMNLASRSTLIGRISADGRILVGAYP